MSQLVQQRTTVRESHRIRRHLAGALIICRKPPAGLDPFQRLNRRLLLGELQRYRQRGRFPRNHQFRREVPEFVDVHGTRCAVGHLLDVSGQGALVQHIASTDNNARVGQLARLPELRAWLAAVGLTVEEAGRIQPSYCFTESVVCFCDQSPMPNLALGTFVGNRAFSRQVRVDRIEGDDTNVEVGDVVTVTDAGATDSRILLTWQRDGDGMYPAGTRLVIHDESVNCTLNEDTFNRPVSIDFLFGARREPTTTRCIEAFATVDERWNRTICGDSPMSIPQTDWTADEGCSLPSSSSASLGSVGLTSIAVLAAILAYRRRRG